MGNARDTEGSTTGADAKGEIERRSEQADEAGS
jgi:hypothetical protein